MVTRSFGLRAMVALVRTVTETFDASLEAALPTPLRQGVLLATIESLLCWWATRAVESGNAGKSEA